ncbi:MAG: Fe-S oxidoreductase [Glaciecola sp.]|jgi:Fe-S oxidoreductase
MNALPLADGVLDAATHGSYCPKMCTFACPVAAATGLDAAVPWSFHRAVADLGSGRDAGWTTPPDADQAWAPLTLCNGCLACKSACTYEQDVPSQIVAARRALTIAGVVPDRVSTAIGHLLAGRGADGGELPALPVSNDTAQHAPPTALVLRVALNDPASLIEAYATLAQRSHQEVNIQRSTSASAALLMALGREDLAADARASMREEIAGASTIVVSDPADLTMVREAAATGVKVLDVPNWLLELLENGALQRSSAPALGRTTWHDPVVLARHHAEISAGRQVLRLLGSVIVEPEGHGAATVAAGPGLGMEVLAPQAVASVAKARAAQLSATGAPVTTAGSATVAALRAAGLDVHELAELVMERTQALGSPTANATTGHTPFTDPS